MNKFLDWCIDNRVMVSGLVGFALLAFIIGTSEGREKYYSQRDEQFKRCEVACTPYVPEIRFNRCECNTLKLFKPLK